MLLNKHIILVLVISLVIQSYSVTSLNAAISFKELCQYCSEHEYPDSGRVVYVTKTFDKREKKEFMQNNYYKEDISFNMNYSSAKIVRQDLRDLSKIIENNPGMSRDDRVNLSKTGCDLYQGRYAVLYTPSAEGVALCGSKNTNKANIAPAIVHMGDNYTQNFLQNEDGMEVTLEEYLHEGKPLLRVTKQDTRSEDVAIADFDPVVGYRLKKLVVQHNGKTLLEVIAEDYNDIDSFIIPSVFTKRVYSNTGELIKESVSRLEDAEFNTKVDAELFMEVPAGTVIQYLLTDMGTDISARISTQAERVSVNSLISELVMKRVDSDIMNKDSMEENPSLNTTSNARSQAEIDLSPEAIDLLQKAYAAAVSYPPLLYRTEKLFPSMKINTEYRQRGKELDILTSRYDLLENEYELAIESRAVTDGSVMVHYDIAPNRDIGAYFTKNNNRITALLTSRSESAFLDGWSEFDHEHLSKIMMAGSRLALQDEMEIVNGNECFVIESYGPRGFHKVWIDPAYGYHICKTVIEKKAADLYGTTTIGDVGQSSFKTVFQVTKFSKINETWFPVEGVEDRIWGSRGDGDSEQYTNTHMIIKRDAIEFNPDFDKIQAFQIDLPEGTWIQNLEFPVAEYIWVNGQAIPSVNKHSLDIIEREMASVRLEDLNKKGKTDVENNNLSQTKSTVENTPTASQPHEEKVVSTKIHLFNFNIIATLILSVLIIVILLFIINK